MYETPHYTGSTPVHRTVNLYNVNRVIAGITCSKSLSGITINLWVYKIYNEPVIEVNVVRNAANYVPLQNTSCSLTEHIMFPYRTHHGVTDRLLTFKPFLFRM